MEKARNYQRDAYILIGSSLVLMLAELHGFNVFPDGEFPAIWLGAIAGILLGNLIRRDRPKELEVLTLPVFMLLNYILFRNGIYIPNYIVLYIVSIGLIIYYFYKSTFRWRIYQIVATTLLLVVILVLDYNMYTNNIIKDKSFNRYMRNEFGIKGSIAKEDLKDIEELFLNSRYNITSLEGIQYFKNLRKLYLSNCSSIKDFSPLGDLNNLKELTIWYMDINKLDEIKKVDSLEEFELVYPKRGNLNSLQNFPNLKNLRIQGLSFQDLRELQGVEDLEKLTIADGQVMSFDGIDAFPNLKELRLYKLYVTDISKIFTLEKLEKVQLQDGTISKPSNFEEMILEKGVYLEKIKSLEEQMRENL